MILDEKKGQEHQKKHQADCIMERAPLYGAGREGYTLKDYYELPEDRHCELIDGIFYDMSAPGVAHQIAARDICRKLTEYIKKKHGGCLSLAAPVDVQLDCDDDTMVQPDVLVVCDRSKVKHRCIYGAPDLVVEIFSASTRWKDSVLKLKKYRAAGVREYWLVDPEGARVVVYGFEADRLEKRAGEPGNSEKSTAFRERDVDVIPGVYGMDQEIPVGVFDGECRINMAETAGEIQFFLQREEIQP